VTRYLIVGAGSAGCVLAARLTEDPAIEVTLLEAGSDYRVADAPASVRAISPMRVLTSSDDSRFRWDDLTAVRTSAQPEVMLWKGRGTGGSSSVNGMLAVRPEPDDLHTWAAAGCEGWAWEDMAPWFNRIETDLLYGDAPHHGDAGPIPVWRPTLDGWGQLELAALEAFTDLGHPYCPDHNAPDSTGIGPYAANIEFDDEGVGHRVSANSAYLEPARDRPNLTVVGDVLVDRVEVERGCAVAVVARHDGGAGNEEVFEADEILLTAGSPFSPAILLRSGLDRVGIGQAVSDHPGIGIQLVYDSADIRPPTNGRHINCFGRYSSGLAGGGMNDMAILAGAHPDPLPTGRYASQVQIALWQPFGHGAIELRDHDPRSMPSIVTGMLADERDLVRLRDGFRRLVAAMRHPALASLPGRLSYGRDSVVIDDLSDIGDLDDDGVDRLLLDAVYDTQHIVGGCRMGAADDAAAVVDPGCRVIGVDALRVIDGSILPTCPRANTHFTVLALAERMAERLRDSTT